MNRTPSTPPTRACDGWRKAGPSSCSAARESSPRNSSKRPTRSCGRTPPSGRWRDGSASTQNPCAGWRSETGSSARQRRKADPQAAQADAGTASRGARPGAVGRFAAADGEAPGDQPHRARGDPEGRYGRKGMKVGTLAFLVCVPH